MHANLPMTAAPLPGMLLITVTHRQLAYLTCRGLAVSATR
jgi:hypothetical protein